MLGLGFRAGPKFRATVWVRIRVIYIYLNKRQ